MNWFKEHTWETILITSLFLVGLFFRLKGISTNHSFWSDEAYVSTVARYILTSRLSLSDGVSLIWYQPLQIITEMVFFILFGFSEWAARMPSVIWGSSGIIISYFLGKKISNHWGGVLSAFLYSFLQLNLSYSTQAKPYSAMGTLLLIVFFSLGRYPIISISAALAASLYNLTGIYFFIPIVVYYFSSIKNIYKKPLIALILSTIFLFTGYLLLRYSLILPFIKPQYNWVSLGRDLMWRQYAFLTLPALFGLFLIKSSKLKIGILAYSFFVFYSWLFVSYSHNVRYLVPFFSVIIVLFGSFWANVGIKMYRSSLATVIAVILLLFLGGYKLIRKPTVYYTPNEDFFADVQNADYKTFFLEWRKRYPDFENYPIISGTLDSTSWYTNRTPSAVIDWKTGKTFYESRFGYWYYSTLEGFISEKEKHFSGFVIIHDWPSFMPEDVKSYVKKNLRLELRVESMAVSPNDKWPLELYSWGFDNK